MNRIRELRKKKGLTQSDLATLCKTTTSNISGWECGKWQPDNDALILLADTFDVTVDYILGRSEAKTDSGWTDEEKALGVGRRAVYLSEDEFDWLELRSEVIRTKGEDYLQTLITMIKAVTKS